MLAASSGSSSRVGARHCARVTPGPLVVAPERLQHDRAVIGDVVKRPRDAGPVDMAGSDEAAVVLVGLEVNEPLAGLADRAGEVELLHVHVEGVEHHAEPRRSDAVDDLDRVAGGVGDVGLEAVQRFDAEDDA